MREATVTLNLKRMLHTEAGLQHLEAHMEKEYSKENLTFWQATRTYRTATDRRAEAQRIVEHYVCRCTPPRGGRAVAETHTAERDRASAVPRLL